MKKNSEKYENYTICERIEHAYEEIAEILDKYRVEWCGEYDSEIWLEPKAPVFKIVSNEVDICDSD